MEHMRWVVVTGNAGDGKTAFLERLTADARAKGATFTAERPNGAEFELNGRRFRTNYDGSQDEDGLASDEVLAEFLAPFEGVDEMGTLNAETRLIAVNEGRLVEFPVTPQPTVRSAHHGGRRGAAWRTEP